ncbi:hypothetical protein [Microbulbifer epialgicus]|uniref:Uncharacterized protein n=1 Tax=Microbulbifer epialgicus TaxID=393907 RepID=A0ABV4NUN4_9GAMM
MKKNSRPKRSLDSNGRFPCCILMEEKHAQLQLLLQLQCEGLCNLAWAEDGEDYQALDETP